MEIPSEEWIEYIQLPCNETKQFNRGSECPDINVVLEIGEEQYWLELYGSENIDTMKYEPMSNRSGRLRLGSSQSTCTP